MTVYIGQASCDERGKYVGGQAGNQSGTELNFRAGYVKPWNGLIRFKDPGAARRCAQAMIDAVNNRHIGYDQGERNTLLPLAEAVGYALAEVSKNCETDCSALDGVCGIAAGAPKDKIYVGGNLCYTGNIADRFNSTGLVTCYGSNEANDMGFWQNGDMLWSTSHAVIVTSGAKDPQGGSTAPSVPTADTSLDDIAHAVIMGRYGNGEQRRALLGDKYDAVQQRVNALLSGTPNAAGTSTGSARIIAGQYKVVASSLNVRSAPTTSASIEAEYYRGEIINSIAADIDEADGYTWAHYTAFSGATRYVAIGTTDGTEKYLVKC